jgi:hypothetical protein
MLLSGLPTLARPWAADVIAGLPTPVTSIYAAVLHRKTHLS